MTILYLATVTNFPELIIGAGTQRSRFAIYTIVCIHAFIEIFVIYSIILGIYNDEYTRAIELDIEKNLDEKEMLISALDLVEDKRGFDMKVLTSLMVEDLDVKLESKKHSNIDQA